MKKITLLFIILITTCSFGQNCKFEKNEIDEFTKSKVVKVKGSILFKTSLVTGMYFQISKINDQKFITFIFSSNNPFSVIKGDEIMLKTKDDKVIKMSYNESKVSESSNIPTIGLMFSSKITIILNDELIHQLKNSEIIKARFYTRDSYFEEDVKKKNQSNISNDIKCIESI